MASKLTTAWFLGATNLRVCEGDAFTHSHVAIFATADHAATAVLAKNSHDDLIAALRMQQAWVHHWRDDKAHGLKPSDGSLNDAEKAIDAALAKAGA